LSKNRFSLRTAFIITLLLLISFQKIESEINKPSFGENKISFSDDVVIYSHSIDILIQDVNSISFEEHFQFMNARVTPISTINIWMKNINVNNLLVRDEEYVELDKNVLIFENQTALVSVELNRALEKFQTYAFSLLYSGGECMEIQGNPPYYLYQFTSIFSYNTIGLGINIRLPEHCNIREYNPENGHLEVVGGYTWVFWSWSSDYLNSSVIFPLVQVFFEEPPTSRTAIWITVIGPFLGVILGASSVYLLMRKREKRSVEMLGKIFLTDDQKLILRIIIENEGKITQKELIEHTQFSKSKISRNLFPLEEYDLIKKEKWGREFKVYITEAGEKILE